MLEWDTSQIKDKKVCYDSAGDLTPIAEQIILYTKKAGMPSVTIENALEFLTRVEMIVSVAGTVLRTPEGDAYRISLEDVMQHVGLKTTAAELSKKQFHRKVVRYMRTAARESVEDQQLMSNPGG